MAHALSKPVFGPLCTSSIFAHNWISKLERWLKILLRDKSVNDKVQLDFVKLGLDLATSFDAEAHQLNLTSASFPDYWRATPFDCAHGNPFWLADKIRVTTAQLLKWAEEEDSEYVGVGRFENRTEQQQARILGKLKCMPMQKGTLSLDHDDGDVEYVWEKRQGDVVVTGSRTRSKGRAERGWYGEGRSDSVKEYFDQ